MCLSVDFISLTRYREERYPYDCLVVTYTCPIESNLRDGIVDHKTVVFIHDKPNYVCTLILFDAEIRAFMGCITITRYLSVLYTTSIGRYM